MTSNILGISVTGLRVAQTALNTTGHNIASAGVEGYSRQRIDAVTNPATIQAGVYVGTGANVQSIERVVNSFVSDQLRVDTALNSKLQTYHDQLSELDRLLSDSSTGLSNALDSFFAAVQNGADDPTSIPARQLIISEADNLSDRFNTIYARFDSFVAGVQTSLRTAVSEANALTGNIADLNRRITDAIGAGNGAMPNDLLDQRDEAIRKLSELINIQAVEQSNGSVNIIVGSGQNLVVGNEARQLSVITNQQDPSKVDIAFVSNQGPQVLSERISGGQMSGLLSFQNSVMDGAFNELGRVAVVLADTFNRVHQRGINLDDEFGGDFFYAVNDPSVARARVIGDSDNAQPNDRVASLAIVDSGQLTTSDYQVRISNGGLYTIERLSDGAEVATGILTGALPATAEFDGLRFTFERGSFQAGDEFRLQPVKQGARDFARSVVDARSIAFGSPVLTDASLGNLGSAEISPGEVLSLVAADGTDLPLLAVAGEMNPPLLVRFTSPTSYDILDNSDPANPVDLVPPIRNQIYVVGAANKLFGEDPGETQFSTNGPMVGLPPGRSPVIGGGPLSNGYPAEVVSITRPATTPGGQPLTQNLLIDINASAKETASVLNNIAGVSANAFNYMEISNTQGLSNSSPLQINLNGADLIEYEFDAGLGTFVVAAGVPDPSVDEDGFNDYLAARINTNSALEDLGIFAVAGRNPLSGAAEIRVYSTQGDDFQLSLEADNTGPDSLSVSDGNNPAIALDGNGAGLSSALAVGGRLDVRLADGISFATRPADSMLFGDTSAADFARSTYYGIQASIRGIPQAGDAFTLDFNHDGASDNRNALNMVDLSIAKTIGNGSSNYSGGYAALVESVGIETSAAATNADASNQVLKQTSELRNSVSGVNLDEEAAQLIRFEQMYSANAQVISVARDLFDRLLGAF